jgi:LuxR family maltose regulon positive regulatory protein
MLWWIEVPRITKCRVLVGEGTQESLQEAVERLLAYQQENQSVHNKYQEIVILTVLAVAFYKQNDKKQAAAVLEQVLEMARMGGWIWPFIESGPPIADLLNQLKNGSVTNEIGAYIDRILAAFPPPEIKTAPGHQVGLVEPLTDRELQVLKLLATTLATDEIADELVVSVNTVRMHTKNIYSKLGAHSRMEATLIGRKLGLI